MTYVIILFGLMTLLAGIVIVINPETLFGLLRRNADKIALHITAVVLRLIIGSLLILYADSSRFPLVILVLGWLSIVAALVFAVIGRANFLRLMNWAFSVANQYGRPSGLFAMAFGGFLVYAFV
jgi:hypothetical protein